MAKIGVNRTELVWPGKYDGDERELERVSLPFQVIERVNESRATRKARTERGLALFDVWKGDEGDTFEQGWRNKLIWGENLIVMSSLLEQFAGKVDLIYIDPPFLVGADFSVSVPIGDDQLAELEKEQSAIEEKAYRDTWGQGLSSYLEMLRTRLVILRELLSPTGSIYLHLGWSIAPYGVLVMNDVFGADCLQNIIVYNYGKFRHSKDRWKRDFDLILYYSRDPDTWVFNHDEVLDPYQDKTEIRFDKMDEEGQRYKILKGRRVYYQGGVTPSSVWRLSNLQSNALEYSGYPTQKTEELLTKIVAASSRPGDLIADFFVGSGTAAVVAERLGRRWIGCDLGRYAIHVTRKRLLDIEESRPFEILNLGKYERRYWQVATFGEDLEDEGVVSLYEYVAFILKLYGAAPTTGLQHLHGKLGTAFVHVGAVDAPVTLDEVAACVEEGIALKASDVHILGWEWEMGMNDLVSEEAKRRGVKLVLRQIPREVMEEQAAAKGDVQFFELAYLDATVEATSNPREVTVSLSNFVIPNPELVPEDVRAKITKWSDYVDYWAVDWDFRDDTFMQGWVTYRTRKNRKLELRTDPHVYEEPGKYRVMVKVIDVFGNDTSNLIPIEVG